MVLGFLQVSSIISGWLLPPNTPILVAILGRQELPYSGLQLWSQPGTNTSEFSRRCNNTAWWQMVHDYTEISWHLDISLNPEAWGFISLANHLEALTVDVEANHVNVQVSAPETWEALPFNNTLHGGKTLLLILNFFPTFDISLIVIIINVT